MPEPKPTLAIDFDGVLHACHTYGAPLGDPVPGAVAFCRRAVERFHLIVFTARALDAEQRVAIGVWLSQHGFPTMFVTPQKPPAWVYLDDRGWRFDGTWPDLDDLAHAQAWWEVSRW
jgi:hypothetical protein